MKTKPDRTLKHLPMPAQKSVKSLALIYTILVVLVSVLPINGGSSPLNNNYLVTIRLDYLFHAILYIPWMVLVWLAFSKRMINTPLKMAGWVVGSLLFVCSMEGVQYLLPYRSYNINDLLANLIGVGLGYLVIAIVGTYNYVHNYVHPGRRLNPLGSATGSPPSRG